MRIAIATVQVPFISGGAEILAGLLREELNRRGHEAEIVAIPFKWYPTETLSDCMQMGSLVDLTEVNGEPVDRVIALKFPVYYLQHPRKVIWLLHQHRQAYDLWQTPYGDLHDMPGGERLRQEIIHGDNRAFRQARKVFTISATVSARLLEHNDLTAAPLYHPPRHHEALHCRDYEDFIFYPSRIDTIKRQALLVEAAAHLKSRTRLVIAGAGSEVALRHLRELIRHRGLEDTVELAGRLSETDMIDFYSRCRAVYFGGFHEDYGYVPLEGLFSSKPVIVHTDAGGPLEFVEHNRNGYVVAPEPAALAAAVDILSLNPALAESLGRQGRRDLQAHRMDWDHVIAALLS